MKQKVVRIEVILCGQRDQVELIAGMLKRWFEGGDIQNRIGYWEGEQEDNLVITTDIPVHDRTYFLRSNGWVSVLEYAQKFLNQQVMYVRLGYDQAYLLAEHQDYLALYQDYLALHEGFEPVRLDYSPHL